MSQHSLLIQLAFPAGDFLKGLVGIRRKYIPFNGGLGEAQLTWLKREVVEARDRGDKIIVLSHVTLNHLAASKATVVWDNQECTKILHEDGAGKVRTPPDLT